MVVVSTGFGAARHRPGCNELGVPPGCRQPGPPRWACADLAASARRAV